MRSSTSSYIATVALLVALVIWIGATQRDNPKPKPKPVVNPTVSTTIFTTTTFPHRVCVTSDGQWAYEAQQCVPDKER